MARMLLTLRIDRRLGSITLGAIALAGTEALRIDRRLGSITLKDGEIKEEGWLRIDRRLGSITLIPQHRSSNLGCGLIAGWGRLH